jgi:hypothetical protein
MNAVKAYGAMEVQFQSFLNSVLDGGELWALNPTAVRARKNERRQCRLYSPSRQIQEEPKTLVIAGNRNMIPLLSSH